MEGGLSRSRWWVDSTWWLKKLEKNNEILLSQIFKIFEKLVERNFVEGRVGSEANVIDNTGGKVEGEV